MPKLVGFRENSFSPEKEEKNLENSSLSGRLNEKNVEEKKYIIPMVDTNSLFTHTRDVESKVELSEERHYREPNEEIKKIKARVGDLFKKMKPLGEDENENDEENNKFEGKNNEFE